MDKEKIKKAVTMILEAIGEDTGREGLKNTPERVADMYEEIFAGINQKPEEFIKIFEEDEHEELIILKDIPFYSVCEHHLMPFLGKAHIGYIPKKNRLLGLSKLARMVEMFAKRLQLQERLTSQVADTIMKAVDPLGVIVIIEAQHLCTTMRGVKKPGSVMVTSAIRGIFKDDESARKEALGLINK
ncbi:MAG TPA: GTP cyclohydrolase I FolE [Candidatus Goldiibacteriota bacterium]|nr:GTP cyclohydrolase I FolE [Candidatus Goldiibacteriota bacterium]HRQ44378.1 GTP cyclohydrolase I FolE [Candidatus Goldiibacteriota bacterium]